MQTEIFYVLDSSGITHRALEERRIISAGIVPTGLSHNFMGSKSYFLEKGRRVLNPSDDAATEFELLDTREKFTRKP